MKPEINWHSRFTQQATWTASLRKHLFTKAGLNSANRILEVGCGTGAVLSELPGLTNAGIHGLDINQIRLMEAKNNAPLFGYTQGDALALPFPRQVFDITFCHFLLLWLENPLNAINEMRRVTRSGGAVIVMAEPDYAHRIDLPKELKILGDLQTKSLQRQGADPFIGSRLPLLFKQAGINLVETGTLEKEHSSVWDLKAWELEWEVLESDLKGYFPPSKLASLKKIDLDSRFSGKRMLHVPTHFAWGWI